jgi:hypothetical protein
MLIRLISFRNNHCYGILEFPDKVALANLTLKKLEQK